MSRRKVIRAISELKLLEDSNSLLVCQKLNLKFFVCFGLGAFILLKNPQKRNIQNIDQILKITYKSSFLTGNMIIIDFDKLTYYLEMSSKEALFNGLKYLKSTKLSNLVIGK